MAAAGVAVYLQCVKGMLVMKKIDRQTYNKLTSASAVRINIFVLLLPLVSPLNYMFHAPR